MLLLLQNLLKIEVFYIITLTFLKYSILALYHQLFSVSRLFRLLNFATAGACTTWFIIILFVAIFQCSPVHMYWDAFASLDYCMSSSKIWLGAELSNFFLDVVILFLPVLMISRLNLTRGKKWSLSGIFLIGGLVCIASMVKVGYSWRPAWSHYPALPAGMILMSLQLGLAFLCTCLPTYAPLLQPARARMRSLEREYTSDSQNKGWKIHIPGLSSKKSAYSGKTGSLNDIPAGTYEQMPDQQDLGEFQFEMCDIENGPRSTARQSARPK
ncbi:hypothetical protein N7470_007053 [Penicillium chermesinum]|nr:hypothetical protein N7470_007053 [Penicillium chermesinum]